MVTCAIIADNASHNNQTCGKPIIVFDMKTKMFLLCLSARMEQKTLPEHFAVMMSLSLVDMTTMTQLMRVLFWILLSNVYEIAGTLCRRVRYSKN